ncbi:MAG TPA: nucleotidyltransferase family protein [Elusimicrobiota bacterium]|nr:nucleotidyltransferase family protein [Elusimicrobiota bacterium]
MESSANRSSDQLAASNILRLASLENVARTLAENGIRCIVLKGAAILLSDESRMGTRPMTDVDLWVPFDPLPQVEKTLFGLGFHPRPDEPGEYELPGDRFSRIDISETVWFLPTEEIAAVWERATVLSAHLRRLDGHDFILHTIAHGAVHHGRWDDRWTQDLLDCRKLLPQGIDGEILIERARRWGLILPLAWAVTRTPWGRALPPGTVEGIKTETPPIRFRLYVFLRERPTLMTGHLLRFLLLPGWTRRFRHLRTSLLPKTHFQRRRYGKLPLPVAYVLRPILLCLRLFRGTFQLVRGLVGSRPPLFPPSY